MEFIILLPVLAIMGILVWFLNRKINQLSKRIIPTLTTQSQTSFTPSPNELSEEDPNLLELDENVINVPLDVKIELEGGDSLVPPNFTETVKPVISQR